MPIWSHPAWPKFRHDPAQTEAPLARVMARLGTIDGLHAGLSASERQEIFLRAVTGEALASFAIEGAPLPAAEIEASVVASLAHRQTPPQRRSDAIAELMLEARAGRRTAQQRNAAALACVAVPRSRGRGSRALAQFPHGDRAPP